MVRSGQQFQPGAAPLVLHGHRDGLVVSCDGVELTAPAPFLQASAALRELRAARAMASETLRHTLAKTSTKDAR